jgi:hypothetical protein
LWKRISGSPAFGVRRRRFLLRMFEGFSGALLNVTKSSLRNYFPSSEPFFRGFVQIHWRFIAECSYGAAVKREQGEQPWKPRPQ